MAQDYLLEETKLITRLIDRDQTALSDLYQKYGGLVFSLALRIVQDRGRAEEVTQDTFLKVWRQPESWNPEIGKLTSWLLTITRYTAIDLLRKEQRRPAQSAIDIEDMLHLASKYGTVDDPSAYDNRLLRNLINQLPVEQMQMIEYAFFGGLSHNEISEQYKLPLGTVKTRLRLGLQKLRVLWLEAIKHQN